MLVDTLTRPAFHEESKIYFGILLFQYQTIYVSIYNSMQKKCIEILNDYSIIQIKMLT